VIHRMYGHPGVVLGVCGNTVARADRYSKTQIYSATEVVAGVSTLVQGLAT
jgi:hypothetical protein